jgi:hypothetical protein
MKYIHKKTGEEVDEERWGWGALYKDGTELHQFDKTHKIFNQVGDVNQSEVRLWVLYELNGDGRIDIVVKEGMKLIHKYINARLDVGTDIERVVRAYKFGYKLNGTHHFTFVLPDNRLVQSTEDIRLTDFNV